MNAARERNVKVPAETNQRVRFEALNRSIPAKDLYREAIVEYAKGTPTPAPPAPELVNLKVDVDDDTWAAFMNRLEAEGLTVGDVVSRTVDQIIAARVA